MPKTWFTYMLRCSDGSLYTGATTDLKRRVEEHNRGKGGAYTRAKGPVTLVYQERHRNRGPALKREAQIKRWNKSEKERFLAR